MHELKPLQLDPKTTTYIGDGVYLAIEPYGFKLFTSDGITVTNEIYLEPDMLKTISAKADRLVYLRSSSGK